MPWEIFQANDGTYYWLRGQDESLVIELFSSSGEPIDIHTELSELPDEPRNYFASVFIEEADYE